MDKKMFVKLVFILSIILSFISCYQDKKSLDRTDEKSKNNKDTIIVKNKNILDKSYEVDFYSKSFSYYWLVDKDTLDFAINVTEYQEDSTLQINISHKEPILFSTALKKINESFPLIKQDFNLSKLNSFYFRDPIYYFDLTKELSTEYEQQFGRKSISYEKLNQFLLNSKLNKQMDHIVNPLDKKVIRYGIEKFHLTEKKYIGDYLPNVDLTKYPEFIINGMGINVLLENKLK